MAGNDHPDFSKPVMVAGTARDADSSDRFACWSALNRNAGSLSTLSERIATHVLTRRSVAGIGRAPARRSLLEVFAVGQFGQAQDAGLGGGIEGGQQRVNVGERPISDVDPAD